VTIFFIVGFIGIVLLLAALVLGDLFDSIFDTFDFDAGGFISGPAIGAFLAAFGFGAALIESNSDWSRGASALGGLAIGGAVGALVGVVTRSLMRIETDPTPRSADLIGIHGTVVTRIPTGGMGEITLVQSGQLMKLAARSDEILHEGTPVVVVAVLSSTSVKVQPSNQS
jgi:membrane protein implicated in regulation of membrane protease activity